MAFADGREEPWPCEPVTKGMPPDFPPEWGTSETTVLDLEPITREWLETNVGVQDLRYHDPSERSRHKDPDERCVHDHKLLPLGIVPGTLKDDLRVVKEDKFAVAEYERRRGRGTRFLRLSGTWRFKVLLAKFYLVRRSERLGAHSVLGARRYLLNYRPGKGLRAPSPHCQPS